jgi:phosphate starvation-inducible PhoH-like protein
MLAFSASQQVDSQKLLNIPAPALQTVSLEPDDARCLAELCGPHDSHLRQIESRLQVQIHNRGNQFQLQGEPHRTSACATLLHHLYGEIGEGAALSPEVLHLHLQESGMEALQDGNIERSVIKTRRGTIKPRGDNQARYMRAVQDHDINFGIGPAGTGKTWLAVACAVQALETEEVQRIILVRPAVEAGEKLGFLPGDMAQKVDPYLRPLYDALYEMLGFDKVAKLIERNIIEIAPLAFMRGRTLNNAFIILDESQNTTREQMKMFLTRIGYGSTAVITGDITQIDLPSGTEPGLRHAMQVLEQVPGISFTVFESKDVVRHPLVQRIVEAYERSDLEQGKRP